VRLVRWLAPLLILVILAWGLVALVSGPTTTRVPSFIGQTEAQALALASKDHLTLRFNSRYNIAAAGTVLNQNTAKGTVVKNGTPVLLTLSRGPAPCCTVPDVSGMKLDEARSALVAENLKPGDVTYVTTTSQPDGTVISQNPTSDARLNPGDTVDLMVAKAPEQRHKKHGHD
jgi:serine/threonine-protein kinase